MSNYDKTIVIRGKNPVKKGSTIPTDQILTKHNAAKNSPTTNMNASKIEKAIDEGVASGPPKIPKDVSQTIQQTRIVKGFNTQKELANSMNSPPITINELQQMENGQFLLSPQNRTKVQAVLRKLGINSVKLPKSV
jgi:hypothetical protein